MSSPSGGCSNKGWAHALNTDIKKQKKEEEEHQREKERIEHEQKEKNAKEAEKKMRAKPQRNMLSKGECFATHAEVLNECFGFSFKHFQQGLIDKLMKILWLLNGILYCTKEWIVPVGINMK